MAARRHLEQTGHPSWFFTHIPNRGHGKFLPEQGWYGYWARGALPQNSDHHGEFYGFDMSDHRANRSELITMIRENLEQGITSTWCGVGHCVTIYGATLSKGQVIS